MEKISEITTTETGESAFEIIMKCKELVDLIDISNIILDNMSIDEKEILIKVIEGVKSLELEIIEYEPTYIPEAKA